MYALHWAALAWHITHVLCASEDAVSVGNDNWGLQLHLSRSPQECAPLRLFFNITKSPDAPANIVLPGSAAISFLTPDTAQDEWMVLQPQEGTGILEWICPLRAGKQFIVKGVGDYEQLFTVETRRPPLPTDCGQSAATVTSSSPYGTLISEVYHSFTAASYSPTAITPSNQFAPTSFPSGDFSTLPVHLGAAITSSSPSPGTAVSHSSTNIGAIVGGVVGGLAAILLGAVLVLLLRRRRKRKQALVEVTQADPLEVEAGQATMMTTTTGLSPATPLSRADRKRVHAMASFPTRTETTELSGSTQVVRRDGTVTDVQHDETETTLTGTGSHFYADVDAPPQYSQTQ